MHMAIMIEIKLGVHNYVELQIQIIMANVLPSASWNKGGPRKRCRPITKTYFIFLFHLLVYCKIRECTCTIFRLHRTWFSNAHQINIFPDINFVLIFMSRVYIGLSKGGRKTGETSCKCISFVPAEIVYYIDDLIEHLYNHPGTNKIIMIHEA